jgi:hypothetical protein
VKDSKVEMWEGESQDLGRLVPQRKSGQEPFHASGRALSARLQDFWRWSVSDLVSNATRGRLAEFIVATALDVPTDGVRDEWGAYDLKTPNGVKVEVKSAAYVQSWAQSNFSTISFRTPRTRAFDPDTNRLDREPKRQADVYVFAVLAHKDKRTIDPLNADQWEFYVLPTATLDARIRSQYGITLVTLKSLCGRAVSYDQLRGEVERAGRPAKT